MYKMKKLLLLLLLLLFPAISHSQDIVYHADSVYFVLSFNTDQRLYSAAKKLKFPSGVITIDNLNNNIVFNVYEWTTPFRRLEIQKRWAPKKKISSVGKSYLIKKFTCIDIFSDGDPNVDVEFIEFEDNTALIFFVYPHFRIVFTITKAPSLRN